VEVRSGEPLDLLGELQVKIVQADRGALWDGHVSYPSNTFLLCIAIAGILRSSYRNGQSFSLVWKPANPFIVSHYT
jgi:hypothetical protein